MKINFQIRSKNEICYSSFVVSKLPFEFENEFHNTFIDNEHTHPLRGSLGVSKDPSARAVRLIGKLSYFRGQVGGSLFVLLPPL